MAKYLNILCHLCLDTLPFMLTYFFGGVLCCRNLNITQIGICYDAYLLADFVIPLGFEPKTHSLEGCCSNPTELRNRNSGAKLIILFEMTKYFLIFLSQT